MNRPHEIVEKVIKVISSCNSLKYIPMMDNYIDLAVQRILERKTTKNYGYVGRIQCAGHYRAMSLIKQREEVCRIERRMRCIPKNNDNIHVIINLFY